MRSCLTDIMPVADRSHGAAVDAHRFFKNWSSQLNTRMQ